ncbi:MAG: outer membrane protein [Syntrophobacteraceae bacterium]
MKSTGVKILLFIGCLLLSGSIAQAADSTPAFNWTGPYAGLHIGYGWGGRDTNFYPLPDAATFGVSSATLNPNPSGVIGGIQAGYNYQMGRWVVGIEADFSGTGMSATKTSSPILGTNGTPIPGGGTLSSHQSIDWFGTLRPRVGYTVTPSVLIYGTGGLAYGSVSSSANTDLRPLLPIYYPASSSTTEVGWAAGGGVEWGFLKSWTIRAQYLYMDLGSRSTVGNPNLTLSPATQVGYKWQTTTNILSFGVNYRF